MLSFKQFLAESKKMLYVYDSSVQKVVELDPADELAMQRFNNKYKFHSDSLYDIPVERGVRVFTAGNDTILVSDDPVALAAEVEERQ